MSRLMTGSYLCFELPAVLLRCARPDDATPETLRILEDLSTRCYPCQRISTARFRFRVSLVPKTYALMNEYSST